MEADRSAVRRWERLSVQHVVGALLAAIFGLAAGTSTVGTKVAPACELLKRREIDRALSVQVGRIGPLWPGLTGRYDTCLIELKAPGDDVAFLEIRIQRRGDLKILRRTSGGEATNVEALGDEAIYVPGQPGFGTISAIEGSAGIEIRGGADGTEDGALRALSKLTRTALNRL